MNLLTATPDAVADRSGLESYFNQLELYGLDAACISCCALPQEKLYGEYKVIYAGFNAEAKRRNLLACININVSISAGDKVDITHAQYDSKNNPQRHPQGFYASFASDQWFDHIKTTIDFFVRDLGYRMIVFDGFEYRVDIPGKSDLFRETFATRHGEMAYPSAREESTPYLAVQQTKAELVREFCSQITTHAKSAGAENVGIAVYGLLPEDDSSLDCAPYPGCDGLLLSRVDSVDFVVSKIPANLLHAGYVRKYTQDCASEIIFSDILALSSGKQTVALDGCENISEDETDPDTRQKVILNCKNAAVAANACGFSLPMPLLGMDESIRETIEYTSRLGKPFSPVAFVFSYSGTRHAPPNSYESIFDSYWTFVRRMAFDAKIPVLTFQAETLEHDLAAHPEVRVLVFDEHFPLSAEQMMVIRDWWENNGKRAAISFGLGQGFSAAIEEPGLQPSGRAYPGMLELIGLKQDEPVINFDEPAPLIDVSRVRKSAFLAADEPVKVNAVAGMRRVFGSRANLLYEVEYGANRIPVVAEWRDRLTLALFCGFGLSSSTAELAVKAVQYALREVDHPDLIMNSLSEGMIWCCNRHDYIVLANLSDQEGSAVGNPGRAGFWDCRERRMLEDGSPVITVAPHSIRILRMVGRRSKFLDVAGCSCLKQMLDGAGRAEIDIIAGRKTTFILRSSPKEIQIDGKSSAISQEVIDGVYYVTLQQCSSGNHRISLRW